MKHVMRSIYMLTTVAAVFSKAIFIHVIFLQATAAQSLEIAFFDTDSRPIKWKENGVFTGPLFDIIDEVSKRSGIHITATALPSKRLIKNLQTGELAGAIGLTKQENRTQYLLYLNTPIAWFTAHLFVLKENEHMAGSHLEDFQDKLIGTVRGITYKGEFGKAVKTGKLKIVETSDYKFLVKMLAHNRIVIAASPTSPFIRNAKLEGVAHRISKLPYPLSPKVSTHIVISKKASIPHKSDTIKKLDSALRSMEKDGVFEKFYNLYNYEFNP